MLCYIVYLYLVLCIQTSVLQDYELLHEAGIDDEEATMVEEILELSKDGLTHDHKQLPLQLLGRLYNIADHDKHEHIKQLMTQANKPHFDCLIPTLGTCHQHSLNNRVE